MTSTRTAFVNVAYIDITTELPVPYRVARLGYLSPIGLLLIMIGD